jgi:phosphoglycerol transferase MdoB-like AlkP superfamily enzyme
MSESKSSGISVFSLLGIVFIVLKLTSVIDWSWWWVTSPFWIPIAVFIFAVFVLFVFFGKRF